MKQYKVSKTSHDYWNVEIAGNSAGDVLGGGPTAATRYKAITPEDCAINPDQAPGVYFTSLQKAAAWLADRQA